MGGKAGGREKNIRAGLRERQAGAGVNRFDGHIRQNQRAGGHGVVVRGKFKGEGGTVCGQRVKRGGRGGAGRKGQTAAGKIQGDAGRIVQGQAADAVEEQRLRRGGRGQRVEGDRGGRGTAEPKRVMQGHGPGETGGRHGIQNQRGLRGRRGGDGDVVGDERGAAGQFKCRIVTRAGERVAEQDRDRNRGLAERAAVAGRIVVGQDAECSGTDDGLSEITEVVGARGHAARLQDAGAGFEQRPLAIDIGDASVASEAGGRVKRAACDLQRVHGGMQQGASGVGHGGEDVQRRRAVAAQHDVAATERRGLGERQGGAARRKRVDERFIGRGAVGDERRQDQFAVVHDESGLRPVRVGRAVERLHQGDGGGAGLDKGRVAVVRERVEGHRRRSVDEEREWVNVRLIGDVRVTRRDHRDSQRDREGGRRERGDAGCGVESGHEIGKRDA